MAVGTEVQRGHTNTTNNEQGALVRSTSTGTLSFGPCRVSPVPLSVWAVSALSVACSATPHTTAEIEAVAQAV